MSFIRLKALGKSWVRTFGGENGKEGRTYVFEFFEVVVVGFKIREVIPVFIETKQ